MMQVQVKVDKYDVNGYKENSFVNKRSETDFLECMHLSESTPVNQSQTHFLRIFVHPFFITTV
jgi:hypothetical protein